MTEAGFTFQAISTGKWRRYSSWRNLSDPFRVWRGLWQSYRIIGRFRPAVIFGKGGPVSLPVVWAAKLRRVPVIIHESDVVPGLGNRLSDRVAAKIAVAWPPEQVRGLSRDKLVWTGNPLRDGVIKGKAAVAERRFKLDRHAPLVLILGGSQGSQTINEAVRGALSDLLTVAQVVHQVGPGPAKTFAATKEKLPEKLRERYHVKGFFGAELYDLYAATDLIVSRAGANAIAEIAAAGLPALLIPLPSAAGDHQRANAKAYAPEAAVILYPEHLTSAELTRRVKQLLSDSQRRARMGRAARAKAKLDATDRLADLVWETGQGSRKQDG